MSDLYGIGLRGAFLPAFEAIRRRDNLLALVREYESNQRLNPVDLQNLQLRKLNALIDHAWDTVPFLGEYWSRAGLRRRALTSLTEFADFPTLTKKDITDNYDRMISSIWRGRSLSKTTGGSTGQPFRLEYTRESDARRRAVMWRGYKWAGADIGTRAVYVWGASANMRPFAKFKEWAYHAAYNRVVLNSFDMRNDNLREFARRLAEARPAVVVGYVSALRMLARWSVENNVPLYRPKSVISAAEALTKVDRELLQGAFRAPVHNTYGCREVMLIAAECEAHSLHVSADHLIVETADSDGRPVSERPGQVLLTDLHNYAMPFVRYVNGDIAVSAVASCSCGRTLPLLAGVEGRLLDAIRTRDGRLLPGEFFPHLFKDYSFIQEFQVVQETLDSIKIAIVPRGEVSPSMLSGILAVLKAQTGADLDVQIELVRAIQRTPSGKFRVTVSKLDARI